ncbi:cytochrome C assembly family protein [Marinicella rhabdoformis]|uniref:cytochrome C assembly family protein n=1 Tax=Marinicella rhabdoformis TaxID=2580566 RepID=UPI0012AEDAAD|nr:cytochrome c biogenesis protein CcsA [Marinicella rhabdoformis]
MTYLLFATFLAHFLAVFTLKNQRTSNLLLVVASALQTLLCGQLLLSQEGWSFNAQNAVLLVSWEVNIIVLLATIRMLPVRFLIHTISMAALVWIYFWPALSDVTPYSWQLDLHIMLSITAYAVLSVSSVLALALAWQIKRMKTHVFSGAGTSMNNLLSNEEKLFKLVVTGWLLLSCALVSGMIFIDGFFGNGMGHKVIFSLIAWILFALLIFGRLTKGWRGKKAIKLNLLAMVLLALGYLGSQIVIDYFV